MSPKRLRVLRLCAIAAIVGVYAASLAPRWLPGADSALYRLLGRSLASGQGYTLFGRPSAFVPPGFPALLAAAEIVGLDGSVALNAIMMAIAGAAVLLAYLVVRQHVPAATALCIGLLFALCNHMHDVSMQVLSDGPCVFLVALGLWLLIRWSRTGKGLPELGVVALVAAGWVRLAAVPLAVGAAAGLLIESALAARRGGWPAGAARASPRRTALNGLGVLVCLAATMAVFYARYKALSAGGEVSSYMHHIDTLTGRSIAASIASVAGNSYHAAETLSRLLTSQRMAAPLAMVLFSIPALTGMVLRLRRGQWVGVAATVCYVGAIVFFRVPIARYLLPVGFLLMMYFADGWAAVFSLTKRLRRHSARIVAGVLIALTACNLPRDLRRIYWVHHPDFEGVYRHGRTELYDTAEWLEKSFGPNDLFVSSTNSYALALLSGTRALPVPKRLLSSLQRLPEDLFGVFDREGVTLLIFAPDDEPQTYTQLRLEAINRGRIRLLHANDTYRVYRYLRRTGTTATAPGG